MPRSFNGKNWCLQKNGSETTAYLHTRRWTPTSYHNQKLTQKESRLNVKNKHKLMVKYIIHLHHLELGNSLLNMMTKLLAKGKNRWIRFRKYKTISTSKHNILKKRNRTIPRMEENTYHYCISDKGFMSRIYKSTYTLNHKMPTNPIIPWKRSE